MAQIFSAFLLTSLMGTGLTIILMLLKPVTRKMFSSGWHYYMWLCVLVVMMLPIRVNLPQAPEVTKAVAERVADTGNHTEISEMPVVPKIEQETIIEKQGTITPKASVFHSTKDFISTRLSLVAHIWVVGGVMLLAIKILSYIIFLLKIHKNSEKITCPELRNYTNRKVTTRVSDTICSPLIIGIFRPTLLLPKTEITPRQLENVLAHETTHLKRNDILYKWFVTICKCVHWYNPFIYLISREVYLDCEISCDLAVVKDMDEQAERHYIETILSLLTQKNEKVIPLTTGMTGNKKSLKKRFTMIKQKINTSKKVKGISLVLAIVVGVAAIVAGGMINGKFETVDRMLIDAETDERQGDGFNFLLIGVDNGDRADTILALNFDGRILTCMNIPRNTALKIGEDSLLEDSQKDYQTC